MFDPRLLARLFSVMTQAPRVAQTPSAIIHRDNTLAVRFYPSNGPISSPPVLIVNSLINRYYILDLMPGKSFVEYLAANGVPTYMIDWGTPDDSDAPMTLEYHIQQYLKGCVAAVKRHAGDSRVSLLGYCMGGTTCLLFAALNPKAVRSLILLATPVDFHTDTLLSLWSKPEYFNVDRFVDTYGNPPVEILRSAFQMLKPTKNVTKYVDLIEKIDDDEFVRLFHAFDYWVNDVVTVPGETFREFIKAYFQENRLVQNQARLGRRRIDVKKITCPVLNVFAEHDSIVPPSSSRPVRELVGEGVVEELCVTGGHHGLSIGPQAQKVVWPKIVEWLRAGFNGSTRGKKT